MLKVRRVKVRRSLGFSKIIDFGKVFGEVFWIGFREVFGEVFRKVFGEVSERFWRCF